ncbi:hypothetical protein chiPu_0023008, partial [Chiloscyllium punctatum]|nr:hypothetical protein [Chiloscyllium punctatum]
IVKAHRKEAEEFYYCIEKDGLQKWYKRMAVILSLEQGNRLREQFGLDPCEATTPLTMAADISLDNLVEGKRKRRSNAGASTPTRKQGESPRGPTFSGKRKLIGSDEERSPAKRGRRPGTGKSGNGPGHDPDPNCNRDLDPDPEPNCNCDLDPDPEPNL